MEATHCAYVTMKILTKKRVITVKTDPRDAVF
jgi:hypothetical protein